VIETDRASVAILDRTRDLAVVDCEHRQLVIAHREPVPEVYAEAVTVMDSKNTWLVVVEGTKRPLERTGGIASQRRETNAIAAFAGESRRMKRVLDVVGHGFFVSVRRDGRR
jgi:hypothetical protein